MSPVVAVTFVVLLLTICALVVALIDQERRIRRLERAAAPIASAADLSHVDVHMNGWRALDVTPQPSSTPWEDTSTAGETSPPGFSPAVLFPDDFPLRTTRRRDRW